MAGPVVSIVLARDPDIADLVSHCQGLDIDCPYVIPGGSLEVMIRTTKPLGGTYAGEQRLFDVRWTCDADDYIDEADDQNVAQAIAATFRFLPKSYISIAAGRNQAEDHRVLGEVALYFARAYGGVIDFGGALIPSSTLSEEQRSDILQLYGSNWSDIAAPLEQFFARLPGRLIAVPYETADARTWVSHVGDTEFMAAWLSHPDFHMIK